jgi:hypothetical protein
MDRLSLGSFRSLFGKSVENKNLFLVYPGKLEVDPTTSKDI